MLYILFYFPYLCPFGLQVGGAKAHSQTPNLFSYFKRQEIKEGTSKRKSKY